MKSGATLKEIADFYNVTPETLKKWLQPIKQEIYPNGKRTNAHTPRQIRIIKKYLG
jgi:uncharacterized protein YjcR